jgi:hypothetical protein
MGNEDGDKSSFIQNIRRKSEERSRSKGGNPGPNKENNYVGTSKKGGTIAERLH